MNKNENEERKRWKPDDLTPEQSEFLEKMKRELSPLSKDEFNRKYVDEVPIYKIGVIPRQLGQDERLCNFCSPEVCGTQDCRLPRGLTPMDLIRGSCGEAGCPDKEASGQCPSECPRYVLQFEFLFNDPTVKWGLIERLMDDGIDLKTWQPSDDNKTVSEVGFIFKI